MSAHRLNTTQLAALVRVWLRKDMHLAGGRGAGLAGVFVLSSLFMLLGSLGAAAMVFAGVPRFAFATLGLLFGSMPTAMSLITDFGVAAVDVSDQDVVGHRPVDDRTYLFARLLTVTFYATAVGLPAQVPYALAGIIAPGSSNLFPFAYLAVAFVLIVATTSAVVVLYATVARLLGPRRLANAVLLIQLTAISIFFVGGPMIGPTTALLARLDIEQVAWLKALPHAWFAALVDVLLGFVDLPTVGMAALAVLLTVVLLGFLPARLSLGYVDALSRQLAWAAGERPPAPGRSGLAALVTAGYQLARASLRDPQTRLRVVPSLVLPVVYATMTLLMQRPASPLSDSGLLSSITALFPAALLAVGPAAFLIGAEFSNAWRASWVFGAAPLGRPGLVQRGVRLAAMRAFIPGVVAYAAIAATLWPALDVAVVSLDIVCAGAVSLGAAGFAVHAFPCSRPLQAGVNMRTQLVMIAALTAPTLAMMATWLLAGPNVGGHLLADLALLLAAAPLHLGAEWFFDWSAGAGKPMLAIDPEGALARERNRAVWWALGAAALGGFALLTLAGTGAGLWALSGRRGLDGMRAWTAVRAGTLSLDGGQAPRASRLAREALRRSPADPEAMDLLGRSLQAMNDEAAAVEVFRARAAAAPTLSGSYVGEGDALRARHDCEGARRAYLAELALGDQRRHADATLGLARATADCGNDGDAMLQFERYLDLHPHDSGALRDYAKVLDRAGKTAEAENARARADRAERMRQRLDFFSPAAP